jgi:hypothetical protein
MSWDCWGLLADYRQAWMLQLVLSQLVSDVCGGAAVHGQQSTEDGLFSMDVALVLQGGQRVALEADGPSHFTSNLPRRPLGATMYRNRRLLARGWRVVSVPFFEWDALGGDEGRQELYLEQALVGLGFRV